MAKTPRQPNIAKIIGDMQKKIHKLERMLPNSTLPGTGSSWFSPVRLGDFSNGTVAANQTFYAMIVVPVQCTLSGVAYRVAATAAGNVRSSLYDATGVRIANRTTNSAQPGTQVPHNVAFDSPIQVNPGIYFIALTFSSASATVYYGTTQSPAGSAAGAGSGATRVSITPPVIPGTLVLMSSF